jgi:hypothetical protein
LNSIEQESVSTLLLVRYYKADGTPFAGFFGLQFCQYCADGVKLSASAFVDVVLVMQDILNIKFQFLKVLA